MRITKLKIFGFKSFAQRTEITFPGNGLTAVVGPNGCGKSNIVDAIRWVLGEQRAAVLRMDKMQGVIFSGTEERAAMSMAEVSLVINNDNGDLPSEYSEVMVTRRAYRNGTSEYLLNNQECRLKDIQNLFFDSGLGTGTYSQMNERMINAVLSSKAEDRRALFEEAAGVSKYKKQRKETVSKMASVQQSMERIEDNLNNTRKNVRQYERQAEKTKVWMQLRSELKALDLSVSLDKYEDNRRDLKILDEAHVRLGRDIESQNARLATLKVQIDERKLAISGDEENLRELEMRVTQGKLALKDLTNEAERLRDRALSLDSAEEKAKTEIENAKANLQNLKAEVEKLQADMERFGSHDGVAEQERLAEREREAVQVLRENCDDLRSRSKSVSEGRFALLQKVNGLKNRWQRIDAEASMYAARIAKDESDLQSVYALLETADSNLKNAESMIEVHSAKLESAEERRAVLDGAVESKKEELALNETTLQNLRREDAALRSGLEVLERMETAAADGTKWILENRREFVSSSLGEQIQVDARYMAPIEFALGDALEAVVLSSKDSVVTLLNDLENAKAGSALFALLSRAQIVSNETPIACSIGCASDFVQSENAEGILVKRLLSKYYLVTSFEEALEKAAVYANQDFWFITPDNCAVHTSGMVRYGSVCSTGVLSRRAEISETESKLTAVATQIAQLEKEHDALQNHLTENELRLAENIEEIKELQETLRTSLGAKQIHTNTKLSLQNQIEKFEKDIAEAKQKMEAGLSERSSDTELNAAETEAQKLEEEYESISARLVEEEQMLRNKEDDLREAERVLHDVQSTVASYRSRLNSLLSQEPLFENIIQSRNEEIEKARAEKREMEEKNGILRDEIEKKHEALGETERLRDEAQERYNVVSGDLEEWRSEEREISKRLLDLTPEIKDIERRADAVRANSQQIKERIFGEWEIDLDSAENVERIAYEGNVDKQIRELRLKIKDLGPLNPGVMEDYEEEKKRLEEVEKQFDDLDRARASLERTIKKLDHIARERFLTTFAKIRDNFQEVFSRLMKDGKTKLELQENVDPLEAEIEVNAQPTGKKMRGVQALSGGERALTAVSLLFAIYMEKPSPYCVLDEVDGPLDDANIGRFVELLRHFSRQTQFILVTHNKRTMAASDMLYGVTQEIKGISRIASVKLEDVRQTSF